MYVHAKLQTLNFAMHHFNRIELARKSPPSKEGCSAGLTG
jgi:hypothetical protein